MPINNTDILKEIKNFGKKNKMIILIIFLLLLGAVLFRPITELFKKSELLSQDIKTKKEELRDFPAVQGRLIKEVAELERKNAAMRESFVSGPEDLLMFLNRATEELKIIIRNVEPQDKQKIDVTGKKGTFIEIVPIILKIKCDYTQLVKFLKKIEGGEKFIRVDDIRIKGDSEDVWNHDIQLQLGAPIANHG